MLIVCAGRDRTLNVATLAFAIIGIGSLGCIIGGGFSQRIGSASVAVAALALSANGCVSFPSLAVAPAGTVLALPLLWGRSVVADSPQSSALWAKDCPPEIVGSALAIQNTIGFSITTAAIPFTTSRIEDWGLHVAWLLLPGPLFGLIALRPLWRRTR